jgi:hypothetical protein
VHKSIMSSLRDKESAEDSVQARRSIVPLVVATALVGIAIVFVLARSMTRDETAEAGPIETLGPPASAQAGGGEEPAQQPVVAPLATPADAAAATKSVADPEDHPPEETLAPPVDRAETKQPEESAVELALPPDKIAIPKAPAEKTYRDLLNEAIAAQRKRRHEDALRLIEESLAKKPTSRAYTLKADILFAQKDYSPALAAATDAIGMSSSYGPAWFTKGMIHWALKQEPAAKESLQKFLEINPRSPKAADVRDLLESLE